MRTAGFCCNKGVDKRVPRYYNPDITYKTYMRGMN